MMIIHPLEALDLGDFVSRQFQRIAFFIRLTGFFFYLGGVYIRPISEIKN